MKARITGRFEYPESDGVVFDTANPLSVSKAKQSFRKEADINFLMSRYQKTGVLVDPVMMPNGRRPFYGDFTQVGDFHALQNTLILARNEFARLPAEVRDRFGNDPKVLLDFLLDPANDVEAVKLGLKQAPPVVQEPVVAPVAP